MDRGRCRKKDVGKKRNREENREQTKSSVRLREQLTEETENRQRVQSATIRPVGIVGIYGEIWLQNKLIFKVRYVVSCFVIKTAYF
jgi:hypothetical protein